MDCAAGLRGRVQQRVRVLLVLVALLRAFCWRYTESCRRWPPPSTHVDYIHGHGIVRRDVTADHTLLAHAAGSGPVGGVVVARNCGRRPQSVMMVEAAPSASDPSM